MIILHEAKTLNEKVALLIVERMESGEKMPTEKEMAQRFNVSRTTLREALSFFQASGIITSLQGSGRYVQMPNLGTQFMDAWSILLWAKPTMLLELLEIRSILEIYSIPQAMQKCNMDQLQQLHVQVSAMKEKASQGQPFVANDREFHRILFSSTNNSLLEQLLTTFWDLYEAANVGTYHEKLMTVAIQHEEILNAFAKQDVEQVTAYMKEQFTDARYRIIMSLLNADAEKKADLNTVPAIASKPSPSQS